MPVVVALESIVGGEMFITEGTKVLGHVSQVLGLNMVGKSCLIRGAKVALRTTISAILPTVNAPPYCLP